MPTLVIVATGGEGVDDAVRTLVWTLAFTVMGSAQVCAGKGIPLPILGSAGKLYLPTSTAMPGRRSNDRLKD